MGKIDVVLKGLGAVALVGTVGCAAGQQLASTHYLAGGQPSVVGLVPTQARLLYSLVRAEPQRQVLNVPSSFASVLLTLANSTLLSGPATKSAAFSSNSASGVFTALRPGAGYNLSLSLLNSGGTEVGTGSVQSFSLPAGQTTSLTAVIGTDNQIAVSTSSVGNQFGTAGNWTLTTGDTVTLSTGFAGTEADASTTSVVLSSGLYSGASSQTIADLAGAPATFVWNTGANATTGGASFTVADLTTTGTQNGTITFRVEDASGQVVGQTILSGVNIVAGAGMNVSLQ